MRVLLALLLFLTCISLVYSADEKYVIALRDVTNNKLVDNVAVYVTIGNTTQNYFVPKNDVLRLNTIDPDSDVVIKADYYSTSSIDYYQIIRHGTLKEGVSSVYLIPAGSLRGIVKDSLDNVVPNARLKFVCSHKEFFSFPVQTDEFGSFYLESIPAGTLIIHTSYGNAVGSARFEIAQGNISELQLMLDKSIYTPARKTSAGFMFLIIFALLIVAVLVFGLHKVKKLNSMKPINFTVQNEDRKIGALPESSSKIMETLNEKEKSVVEYLLKNNKAAQQSSIRHATHIPRTSLSRVTDSLEKKKIVSVEKNGKSVRLTLSDFFMEKK